MDEQGQKAQKRAIARIQDYKLVFEGSPAGKRVLYDLMLHGNMMHSTMSANATINDVLIREGERNMVLRILSKLKVDIKKVQEMIAQGDEE